MDSNMVACLCWVRKGFSNACPREAEPGDTVVEEYKSMKGEGDIMQMTKHIQVSMEGLALDKYDNEESVPIFAEEVENMKDIAEEEEEYPEGYDTSSDEEKEDYTIRRSDACIVAAVTQDEFSNLEVYVFDETTSTLYIHHDIMLSAYPLAIQWLPYRPSSIEADPTQIANFVILATFLPQIEIWNLDLMNAIEPDFELGGTIQNTSTGKKKSYKSLKQNTKYKKGSHEDSVLCLSLNPMRNNILASGSADSTIKLWDLNTQQPLHTLRQIDQKFQVVHWNPVEEAIIVSGSLSGRICIQDVREEKTSLSMELGSDIESATWYPHSPYIFMTTTENGEVYGYDARALNLPLMQFKGHSKTTSSLAFSYGVKDICVTAGLDQLIKVWDIANLNDGKPALVATKEPGVGKIFACDSYADQPWLVCAGGDKGTLFVWDMLENQQISEVFGNRIIDPTAHKANKEDEGEIHKFLQQKKEKHKKPKKK